MEDSPLRLPAALGPIGPHVRDKVRAGIDNELAQQLPAERVQEHAGNAMKKVE